MISNNELRRKYMEGVAIANTVYKMTGTDAFFKAFEWFTEFTPICLPLCCDCIGDQSHSIPAHSYEVFYEEDTFPARCPWQEQVSLTWELQVWRESLKLRNQFWKPVSPRL